jgi:two-component system, sensor histidine kinase and response regulator
VISSSGDALLSVPQQAVSVFAALRGKLREKGILRVLLAEDNLLTQRLVADALQCCGHRVDIAHNGSEAVELWRLGGYDLVLIDLQMPGMDGLGAIGEIRRGEAERRGVRTPIVAVTANVMRADREAAMAAGADDYFPKPINITALLGQLHDASPSLRCRYEGVFPSPCERFEPHLDIDSLPPSLRRDGGKLEEYVALLLRDLAAGISRMERAVVSRDAVEIEKAGHAMKGAAVHLRDRTLQELAAEAERRGAAADVDGANEKLLRLKAEYESLRGLFFPGRGDGAEPAGGSGSRGPSSPAGA